MKKYRVPILCLSLIWNIAFATDDVFLGSLTSGDLQHTKQLIAERQFDPDKIATYLITALQAETTEPLEILLDSGFAVDARTNDSLKATAFMYAGC